MATAADVIANEFCSGAAILPTELVHLLGLLRSFKKRNTFLIRYHAALQ